MSLPDSIVPWSSQLLGGLPASGESPLRVNVSTKGSQRLVTAAGELDPSTRPELVEACLQAGGGDVTLDLAGLTFMDSGGYDAIEAINTGLRRLGHVLTVSGTCGQPARLIAQLHGR